MLEVIKTSNIFNICRIFLVTSTRIFLVVSVYGFVVGLKHLQRCVCYIKQSVLPIIPVSNWNLVRQDMSEEMTKTCPVFIPGEKNCFS